MTDISHRNIDIESIFTAPITHLECFPTDRQLETFSPQAIEAGYNAIDALSHTIHTFAEDLSETTLVRSGFLRKKIVKGIVDPEEYIQSLGDLSYIIGTIAAGAYHMAEQNNISKLEAEG